MTTFSSHPATYTGLPYLAIVDYGRVQHTAVIDFVHDGQIHYVHLEALDFDSASAFLVAVEEYYATSARQLPLSVFLDKHNYNHVAANGWRSATTEAVESVTGIAPHHWFHCAKVKWRRKDIATGQVTGSKNRRSREQIEADKVKAIKEREDRVKQVAADREAKRAAKVAAEQAKVKAKEDKVKAKHDAKMAVIEAIKCPVKRRKEELRLKHSEELAIIIDRQRTARKGQVKINKEEARKMRDQSKEDHVARMLAEGLSDEVVTRMAKRNAAKNGTK